MAGEMSIRSDVRGRDSSGANDCNTPKAPEDPYWGGRYCCRLG